MRGGHVAVNVDVAGVQRNVETEMMTLNMTRRNRLVYYIRVCSLSENARNNILIDNGPTWQLIEIIIPPSIAPENPNASSSGILKTRDVCLRRASSPSLWPVQENLNNSLYYYPFLVLIYFLFI